jgi:hypothetical protein
LRDFQLVKLGVDALAVVVLGFVIPFAGGLGLTLAVGHPRIEASDFWFWPW